jgi:hypothetical protein
VVARLQRRLDPFRTWEKFVATQLVDAESKGLIHSSVDVPGVVWIIVAAGIGTKDLFTFHGTWSDAPARLEGTVRSVLDLVRTRSCSEVTP